MCDCILTTSICESFIVIIDTTRVVSLEERAQVVEGKSL